MHPIHSVFGSMVFAVGGSNGTICGSIKSKMAAGGQLGMMALSRVTLASAGLSCTKRHSIQDNVIDFHVDY